MVSAVSSQAATSNPLAYTALDGDDNAKQPASNATPTDSDRGPATQVSLLQDALDRLMAALKQGPDAAQQGLDQLGRNMRDAGPTSEERFNQTVALMQVNMKGSEANLAFPGMLNEQLATFAATQDDADAAPTQQHRAMFNELHGQLEAQLAKWNALSGSAK